MKRFAVFGLPIVLWTGLIFALSAQSYVPHFRTQHADKLMHLAAYSVWGLLLTRCLWGYGARLRTAVLAGLVAASAYGATDEVHQMWTPKRTPDVRDWVADTVGGALGAAAYAGVVSFLLKKREGEAA